MFICGLWKEGTGLKIYINIVGKNSQLILQILKELCSNICDKTVSHTVHK